MTNFGSGAHGEARNAFGPTACNPFLASDPLTPEVTTGLDVSAGLQMMPAPALAAVGLEGQGLPRPLISVGNVSVGNGGKGETPVLIALANELAPDYPQLAKALVAPTLDNALQSGIGLVSNGAQRLETNVASGTLRVGDTAREVGGSVRDMAEGVVESLLTRWNAPDNSARRELTQQVDTLANELKTWAADVEDSAWMRQWSTGAKRRLESARSGVESATEDIFGSLGYVGDASGEKAATTTLAQAELRLKQTLIDLRDRPDFVQTLETVFGDDWTPAEATAVVNELVQGESGPTIEIVEAKSLLGEGAFGDNTIFISETVLAEATENPEALDKVLLEETGHYFDQALNTVDSAGDEGDLFARLANDEAISAADMLRLKSENDQSTIMLNDTAIEVENRYFLGGSANHPFTVPPTTTPVVSSSSIFTPSPVFTPPTIPSSPSIPTPVSGSDRRLYLQAGTVDSFDAALAVQNQIPTPVPQPAPVVPVFQARSEPAGGTATVEVKAGDTLSAIAANNGVQWTDLRKPDGSAFTEAEARVLQVGADVVLPTQPVPVAPAPVTPPTVPVTTPVASPAAINRAVEQLKADAATLTTASPYAAQAMQEEAEQLIAEENARVAEAERLAAEEQRQAAAARRQEITQLTTDSAALATASPYAAQAMNEQAQALIADATVPDPQQLKDDSELLATASPYASQAMNEQAEALIEEAEKAKTQQLFTDSALLATASPYASEVMYQEATERADEERADEESLSEIEQLQRDSELLATASPYASRAMHEEAEVLIAQEKRQTIKDLQRDSELLATASPYASQAMQAEAEALIAEDSLSEIEQLQNDSELLATASPYASRAMQAEAEVLIAEEKRLKREQLQADSELLATVSPYASQAMQAQVDDLIEEERREEITALNHVSGQGLEHRFIGTNPEAAEFLGTGNYDDNFLSGFDLDLGDSEQVANEHNGNDNHIILQSIFDPVVAHKPTTIDEYSVQVELPDDVLPSEILGQLAIDMDGFLGGEFADLGDFKNQGETPAEGQIMDAEGQIIDIDVKDGPSRWLTFGINVESPFNAPVIITEIEDNNFTVQTIEYNNVEHLLHGTREWGYERMPDGTVRFYTRGISVEDIQAAEGIPLLGNAKDGEFKFWNAWVDGIENYIVGEGGSIVDGSRINEQTEGPSGNDIWETLTFEQQEMARAEQIAGLERELARHLEESEGLRGHPAANAARKARAIRAEIQQWENR